MMPIGPMMIEHRLIESMQTLVAFYPRHIEKEGKHFFIPVMEYFNKDEKDAMLKEGYEFDQGLIHEKYRQIVERGEKNG
jgi:hemerythrin-like domain-containing protein